MNIFSEIYGIYYRIAEKILEKSGITDAQITKIISEYGFRDSVLFLPRKLLPQKDGSDWGLLRKTDSGELVSVLKNPPQKILTLLQKRWLKAKLGDQKMQLFLSDESMEKLNGKLKDVRPLYKQEHFRYTDRFSDGDNYCDSEYRKNFRTILNAVKMQEVLEISFQSGRRHYIVNRVIPLKIGYSQKNDKMRLLCFKLKNDKIVSSVLINIGRIRKVERTGIYWTEPLDLKKYFSGLRCKKPVTVYVTTGRNAVERFLMEFASYEKQTELDLETGGCTVKLWYDSQDETELLIMLLSFGPMLEILGPPEFRRQAAERVKKQAELLFYGVNEKIGD